jgi:hypothetical protein
MIWAVRDTPQLAGDGRNRAAGEGGDLPEPVLLNIELTRDELVGGERWIRMIGTTCRTMRRWRATDRSRPRMRDCGPTNREGGAPPTRFESIEILFALGRQAIAGYAKDSLLIRAQMVVRGTAPIISLLQPTRLGRQKPRAPVASATSARWPVGFDSALVAYFKLLSMAAHACGTPESTALLPGIIAHPPFSTYVACSHVLIFFSAVRLLAASVLRWN